MCSTRSGILSDGAASVQPKAVCQSLKYPAFPDPFYDALLRGENSVWQRN